jgi:hypothetical protein
VAETFDIYVMPPSDKYHEALRSTFECLFDLGWHLVRVTHSENDSIAEAKPGSREVFLTAKAAIADFEGVGRRWIELTAGFNRPGRIELGSDRLFFESAGGSIEELRILLRQMQLPVGTFIIGDVESVLNRTVGITKTGIWSLRDIGSSKRLRRFGFFWIDQLTASQWNELLAQAPEFAANHLAVIGNAHVVRMWKDPYSRASAAPKLRALAKAVGLASN